LNEQLALCFEPSNPFRFHTWQSKLDDLEKETLEHNSNSERLLRTHSELAELQVLLEKAGQFFQSANQSAARAAVSSNAASDAQGQDNMGAPLLAPDREAGQVCVCEHCFDDPYRCKCMYPLKGCSHVFHHALSLPFRPLTMPRRLAVWGLLPD